MELEVTKAVKKVLLVGEERICRQVAYVLGFEDYELLDELTEENYLKFKDYEIYVSKFKRKSKKIVAKGLLKNKEIKYLEDICRAIDKEYKANCRKSRQESKQQLRKYPFFAKLKLRVFNFLVFMYFRIKGAKTIYHAKRCQYHKIKDLKSLASLRCLKPSELFLYVLKAPVNERIECSLIERDLLVSKYGEVRGCCNVMLPFGNLVFNGELNELYNSIYAKIIKLSSLNHSYCLCNLYGWCHSYLNHTNKPLLGLLKTQLTPERITVAFDRTCNLCCKSCRNKRFIMDTTSRIRTSLCADKLQQSGFLDKTRTLVVAGHGEVFYSRYYRQLLETNLTRENINIFSNGILFNKTNWDWLKGKYKKIDVGISVDAVTAETYQKLRGGNFDILLDNLTMLGELRSCNKIGWFVLHFVVQRDNFREMADFVKLGKRLGVDNIEFQRMNNFGNLSKKQHQQRCLIIDDKYLDYELWQVLQDPIFKEPIVDLSGFNRYLIASAEKYQNVAKVEEVK